MKRLLLALAVAAAAVGVFAAVASAATVLNITPNVIHPGGTVTVSGTATDAPYGEVWVWLYSDSTCETLWAPEALPFTVDESGAFSDTIHFVGAFPDETIWALAWSGVEGGASACVPLTITNEQAALPPPPDGIFLCYSKYQTTPGVWPADEAAQLLKQGYWMPYAVPNNETGGTNIGGYHLVCNLGAAQSVSSDFVGGDGTVLGSAYSGVPGLYPKVG